MPTILVSTDIPSNQSLTQSSLASATANLGQSPEHSFFSDWRNMVSVIIPVAVLTSGCLLGIGYFIHRRMNRKRNIHQLLAT